MLNWNTNQLQCKLRFNVLETKASFLLIGFLCLRFIENVNFVYLYISDVNFVYFRIPFYYEVKMVFVFWLLSPVTQGSSFLYKKFVHPQLLKREKVYTMFPFYYIFVDLIVAFQHHSRF